MWEIFEALIKSEGITISEAARRCGISPSTLTDWRAGRYTPKADKMRKIADAFGVSFEYLTTGKDAETADEVIVDPNIRLLLKASRNAKPEAILLATQLLLQMQKEGGKDGDGA